MNSPSFSVMILNKHIMKTKLFLLLAIFFGLIVKAQTTSIPDANFEHYLETHSKINLSQISVGDANSMGNGIDGDHLVTTANISAVTYLSVNELNISDLTGIEDFTSLTDLSCSDNNLTTLTLPPVTSLANLIVERNNLTTINLPNTLVEILEFSCADNKITSINFNNVNYINFLYLVNNKFTTLDFSNTNVQGLEFSDNPFLTSIDLRNGADYTEIYGFYGVNNPLLTCVFVDNVSYANANWKNNVDSTTNFVDSEATCNLLSTHTYVPDDNFEQALIDEGLDDVLDNYVLTNNINSITFLDVSDKNISDLTGIEDFLELETFGCENNQLTTIDLSNNHILEFGCNNNQLTSLILNAEARVVDCSYNLLTALIVPSGIANLQCNNNNITSLDLSSTTELSRLNVSNNNLEFLDFRNGENDQISSSYDYNTGYDYSFDATNNPNLTCIFVDDATFSTTNWKKVDATAHFVIDQAGCDASITVTTYVPNNNFEQALIDGGYDNVLDDYVLTDNIRVITDLDVSNKNISDLTGIEDFKSLVTLSCNNNSLTSLNVTQNTSLKYLNFSFNQVSTIDVSKNIALEKLTAVQNQLTSLDVTTNTSLKHLECWQNQITSLDVSKNTILEELYVKENALSELDVTNNIALKFLSFGGEMNTASTISSIDISNNTQLFSLDFIYTQISELVTTNNPNLERLFIRNNKLKNLDVSQNPVLEDLVCEDNQLRTLNVKNGNNINFYRFSAFNNSFLNCIQVDDPSWSNTNWTAINGTETFGDNCHYYQTYVPDDNFEQTLIDLGFDTGSLDDYVSTNNINTVTDLEIINKNIADLTGLEDFDALTYLDCSYNLLTNLSTIFNENLEVLRCDHNQLTSLDINGNVNLTQLFCGDNNLTSLDYLYYAQYLNFLSIENNQISNIDIAGNSELLNLLVGGNNLSELEINNNTKLTVLSVSNNKLSSLNTSNNPDLFHIFCSGNLITSIDISNNPAITRFICFNNLLSSLDMRNGNNTNISDGTFNAKSNPDLTCIYVDDTDWSYKNWKNKDAASHFVADETACNALSVENHKINGLKILSNPIINNIKLSTTEKLNFVLTDINGKTLKSGKLTIGNNTINVSKMAKGICFLRVTSTRNSSVKKIIIQ
ncbi:Por secretion system C-terminal sorting domain-containing protein [Polaribacter sp. KT25b]|nr:Por secretion system C-terminal sorting domain-containing protein [Polaribacter sp. KT25b]